MVTENTDKEGSVKDCTVAEDHPCTRGHFPGQPVVPGAFLLARVEELILEDVPGLRMVSLGKVKFLKPLSPGVTAELHYHFMNERKARFDISDAFGRVLEGSASFEPV